MVASTQTDYSISSSYDSKGNVSKTGDSSAEQDRFLKLLVAQLNNQDPMNPMDNAQMTSQIAQINTVTGINTLNKTVNDMAAQFATMQMVQGSAMVGQEVLVSSDRLHLDSESKIGSGSFDLSGKAASVTVQVLDDKKQVVGTVPMGSLNGGRYSFDWDMKDYKGSTPLSFKVVATNGNVAVDAETLARDKVVSVSSTSGALQLQLEQGGYIGYGKLKAVF